MTEDKKRFVDTSVLVRYFTDDIPEQAATAEAIIDREDLLVNCVILAECGYVLTRLYNYARPQVVAVLVEFLQRENVSMSDMPKEFAAAALLSARDSHKLSFGDALIIAAMRASEVSVIYSFDRRFGGEGVTVLRES